MNYSLKTYLLVVWLLFGCVNVDTSVASAADDFTPTSFLRNYCTACHGGSLAEADLQLDALDRLTPKELQSVWHAIWAKVSDREMPPADEQQPTDQQRADLLAWIVATHGSAQEITADDHWAFRPAVRVAPPVLHSDATAVGDVDAFVLRRLAEQQIPPSPQADRRTLIRRLTLDLIGLPPTPEEVQAFLDDDAAADVAWGRVVDRLLQSPHYGERWAQHWLDVIRWAETVGFETNAERQQAWHYRDWVIDSLNADKPYDRFVFEQIAGDTVGEDAALGFLVAGPANLAGQVGRDEEAMRQARQDELDEVVRTVSQSLFGLTIGCARCHDHKFDPIKQQDYYALQAVFAGISYGQRRLRGAENDQWTAQVPQQAQRLIQLQQKLEQQRVHYHLRPPLTDVQTEEFDSVLADAVRIEIEATNGSPASLYELEAWSTATDDQPSRNVALAANGGKPSASSFLLANQTRHFDNLVDGTVDPRQAFPWAAENPGPAWVQVDLAAVTPIERVIWQAGSSVPASYQVQVREQPTGKWHSVADTRDRLPRIDDRRPAANVQIEGLSESQVSELVELLADIRAAEQELQRLSQGPQVYAASFEQSPESTYLLHRGDPMQRRQTVAPAPPEFLLDILSADDPPAPITEAARRANLAYHLTQPGHPLTARVIVNRLWQHHFGSGLVETSSDFGKMGVHPSHPELLDWLAQELVAQGWSLKKLHRLIVCSQTYRQSSQPREDGLRIDAGSRLLWRYPPHRLEAEAIRDSVLSVSGQLNNTMHGRGFDFFNQRGGLSGYQAKETFDESGWRRMIYAHKIRMESVNIFGAFDCPDAGQMTPRRNQSITPIQSLGLFNSPFVMRQAEFFALRVAHQAEGDVEQAVRFACELAYARPPQRDELMQLVQLAHAHGLEQVCRVIFNSSEFLFLR